MSRSLEVLRPAASGPGSLQRRTGVVSARLCQTALGFELVSDLADDPSFAGFCRDIAGYRRSAAAGLAPSGSGESVHPFIRLLGGLHRAWIRFVASGGDATLADELDRMDAALERSIRRLLLSGATRGDRQAHRRFVRLRARLEESRRELLCRRADLEWGSGSPFSSQAHRDRVPAAGDEPSGPASKPQRRLPVLPAVSEEGDPVDLGEVAGEAPIVLTFIPKLNRRSRKRLEGFNRRLPEFEVRDTRVVGVAKARPQQLRRVAESKDLDMPLLADPDGELAEAVDAVDTTGRPLDSTMLIDRDREVLFVSLSAGRESHAAKMLEAVDRYREWFPRKMGVPGDAR